MFNNKNNINLRKIIICQSLARRWLVKRNYNLGLTAKNLSLIPEHINFKPPKTQLDFYIENHASQEILKYVPIQGKTFGEKYMENLAKIFFNLDPRSDSSHDHKKLNKTIEQKSARYHANGNDWKWQHIEMNHEWDYLMLTGLDFQKIRFYITSRDIVNKLIKKNIITGQGKKNNGQANAQQGYWFSRSDFKDPNKFLDFFKEINSEEELINYIKNN